MNITVKNLPYVPTNGLVCEKCRTIYREDEFSHAFIWRLCETQCECGGLFVFYPLRPVERELSLAEIKAFRGE